MFQIKICGITTLDDALLAAAAGADAIGLNFFSKKRSGMSNRKQPQKLPRHYRWDFAKSASL